MILADIRWSWRAPLLLVMPAAICCRAAEPTGVLRGAGPVPVTVAEVTTAAVPLTVRAVGKVEAKNSVAVRAQVGGVLTALHFDEGAEVAAGALLFTLDVRPFRVALLAAEAALARDRVLLAKAEEDARRYGGLVKSGFVTQERADQARTTAASLSAAVQADIAAVEGAKLQLDYCTIRAPVAGRVGQALVDVGNVVKAHDTQPLVVLLQTRPLEVTFSLPERTLPALRAALGGRPLAVTATPAGNDDAPVSGKLIFVDNAVDPTTGTLLLKAELTNDDGALWPGQFVDVSLALRVDEDALVVPAEAVQNGREGTYVFVVESDDTVQVHPITVLRETEGMAVVGSGLTKGAVVVRDGHVRLVPSAKIIRKTGAGVSGS